MKTARGTVNLFAPVRLLWVELRETGEQFPVGLQEAVSRQELARRDRMP